MLLVSLGFSVSFAVALGSLGFVVSFAGLAFLDFSAFSAVLSSFFTAFWAIMGSFYLFGKLYQKAEPVVVEVTDADSKGEKPAEESE